MVPKAATLALSSCQTQVFQMTKGEQKESIRPRKKLQMEKHRAESSEDSTMISTVGRKRASDV